MFNSDCFEVHITGYDKIAQVRVTPNYEEIKTVVMEVLDNKKELDDDSLDVMFAHFYEALSITADKEEGLQNGDIVTITIEVREKILEEYNVKIANTKYYEGVGGLDTSQETNPFEHLDIYVLESEYAINGLSIHLTYPDGYYGLTANNFSINYSNDTEKGDTISISIDEFVVNKLKRQGILLTCTDSLEYYGGWINTYPHSSVTNKLTLIYEAKVSQLNNNTEPIITYIEVTFDNIITDNEGHIDMKGAYAEIDYTNTTALSDEALGEEVLSVLGKTSLDYYTSEYILSSSILETDFDSEGKIQSF